MEKEVEKTKEQFNKINLQLSNGEKVYLKDILKTCKNLIRVEIPNGHDFECFIVFYSEAKFDENIPQMNRDTYTIYGTNLAYEALVKWTEEAFKENWI